jgi:hypothetical protein
MYTDPADVSDWTALIVKDIETICSAVDLLISIFDESIQDLKQTLAGYPETADRLFFFSKIDSICSNADVLLISLGKLEEVIKQTLAGYPDLVYRLLHSLALIDDNVVRIKSNAIKTKQTVEELVPLSG